MPDAEPESVVSELAVAQPAVTDAPPPLVLEPELLALIEAAKERATAALAIAGERRRAERDQLQARLRGEAVDDDPGTGGAEDDEP